MSGGDTPLHQVHLSLGYVPNSLVPLGMKHYYSIQVYTSYKLQKGDIHMRSFFSGVVSFFRFSARFKTSSTEFQVFWCDSPGSAIKRLVCSRRWKNFCRLLLQFCQAAWQGHLPLLQLLMDRGAS